MQIKNIEIENFRGLTLKIENIKKDSLIIGKNDSGKSNLCLAIRKVLDYKVRRIPLIESDSTNNNKDPISIKIILDVTNLSKAHRSIIGTRVERREEKEYLTISLYGEYDENIESYNEAIYLGETDQSQEYSTNRSIPLDKILNIIYINPNYNFERDSKIFLSYKQKTHKKDGLSLGEEIKNSVITLNENIRNDETIKEMKDEINNYGDFESIFAGTNFDMISNINISNIYNSLNIVPLSRSGNEISGIGDGKNKVLSMLLQRMSYDKDKKSILIIEEPENHLYPLLQKHYTGLIAKLNACQTIYTSHSPFIIDFKKMNQIIKLENNDSNFKNYSSEIKPEIYEQFGYLLNEELSEMFFYDTVLLVEGLSEKYFYNHLYNRDSRFRDYILKNNIGIFNIMGVNFSPIKIILESLNIKVLIKTDNDIFKVPYKEEKRYAGYERVLDCLRPENKGKLEQLLGEAITQTTFRFPALDEGKDTIETNFEEINRIFELDGIYISNHQNGFEQDLLEFINEDSINEEDLKILNKAKLKNLHEYILKENIPININDKNRNSILVRFATDVKY